MNPPPLAGQAKSIQLVPQNAGKFNLITNLFCMQSFAALVPVIRDAIQPRRIEFSSSPCCTNEITGSNKGILRFAQDKETRFGNG